MVIDKRAATAIMIDCRNFFIFVFFLCLLFQFVEGFFLFALQRYDGFSHGENIFVLFICASCDKPMELRQMGEKALKSVAKVALGKQKHDFFLHMGVPDFINDSPDFNPPSVWVGRRAA
jgi:hypothetical protein